VPTRTAWLWVAPSAARALATRDLGIILRVYRKVNQLSQVRLAEQLGYDPAYISLLECGKRTITDRDHSLASLVSSASHRTSWVLLTMTMRTLWRCFSSRTQSSA